VRARYAEAHRRYHTEEHLDEVLAAVAELADLADDRRAVELAALFHDAIYDPRASGGANERASAELAVELGAGQEVARLVLLTATHEVEPGDRNGAVLCDADLGILGSAPERYARYAADVRTEYAHVDDDGWRAGRGALLRGLLARPRLFRTDRFHERLDAAARRNLRWELDVTR
jgi:predicted metal-dependent HD superfamily phosphohydrolase